MKKTTVELFIDNWVTIKYKDGEKARGILKRDPYHKNNYLLVTPGHSISSPASCIDSIKSYNLLEKIK